MRKQIYRIIITLMGVGILGSLGMTGCNMTGENLRAGIAFVEDVKGMSDDGAAEQQAVEVSSISQENYAYSLLNEEEQKVYDQMLDCILKQEDKIVMLTKDTTVMEKAYNAMNADYGGLFWNSGYVYTRHTQNEEVLSIDFQPEYTMTYEERLKYQQKIDEQVDLFLAGISMEDSDYAKVKYVFENLISQVDYETNVENDQNIISVFLNKKTVCQGYACATTYLLDQLNVQSVIVTGSAGGEAHAWNLVQMDGDYYYVDTTWGNSAYLDSDSQETKYVNYNYLGMTSQEIEQTHSASVDFALPQCDNIENNYYVREGMYVDAWEEGTIGERYRVAWEGGAESVTLKFADASMYENAKQYFITDRHIADYCEGLGTFYYLEDTSHLVLTVYLQS